MRIVTYKPEYKNAWNDFVQRAKNGVFLFHRDYMDYHADRFPDHSFMFYDERDQLIALLPATARDHILTSHAGLTFGGIVTDINMKIGTMLDIFDALVAHLSSNEIVTLIYKAVPYIYHQVPAQEDLYALFRHDARLVRRDLSTTIDLHQRPSFTKGRKWSLKQAQKAGLEVVRSQDFGAFMSIEEKLLAEKYGARPVHSVNEIEMLAQRFPDNVKLFAAQRGSELLGGVIIYESAKVAHVQYIGTTEEGRRIGALDLIIDHLINDYYSAKDYFDFGISTEDSGRSLNTGLVENKQSYGARAVVYDFYQLDLDTK